MQEQEIIDIIERHEIRKAWEILLDALHKKKVVGDFFYRETEQIRKLQDIGVFLEIVK